jgi:DHA1 family tetracycline resistance protein-like MFS transporter
MTRSHHDEDEPHSDPTMHSFGHYRRNIFILLLLDMLGVGMTSHIIPRLITQMTSNDISAASGFFGIVSSVSSLVHFVTSPLVGTLSDHHGRKLLILYSIAGNTIGYSMLLMSTWHMDTTGLFLITCARISTGLTGHLKMLCYAYISDVIDPSKRAQGFGLLGVAFGVGFFIGPSLGGVTGSIHLAWPFLVATLIQCVCFVFVYFFLNESLRNTKKPVDVESQLNLSIWQIINPLKSLRLLLSSRIIFMMAVATFIADTASTGNHAVWVHYTTHRYKWEAFQSGLYLTILGACTMFTQGILIHYMVPFFGDLGCIYIGSLINVAVHIAMGIATEGWMMYAIVPFVSIATIGSLAIRSELTRQVKDKHLQGSLQGSLGSLQKLSKIIGPLITTNIFRFATLKTADQNWMGIPFITCSIMYLTVALVVYRCHNSQ